MGTSDGYGITVGIIHMYIRSKCVWHGALVFYLDNGTIPIQYSIMYSHTGVVFQGTQNILTNERFSSGILGDR